jgi:hypothetical protein
MAERASLFVAEISYIKLIDPAKTSRIVKVSQSKSAPNVEHNFSLKAAFCSSVSISEIFPSSFKLVLKELTLGTDEFKNSSRDMQVPFRSRTSVVALQIS